MNIEAITTKEAQEIAYKTAILVSKGWRLEYIGGEWIHPNGNKYKYKTFDNWDLSCIKEAEQETWPFEEACEEAGLY